MRKLSDADGAVRNPIRVFGRVAIVHVEGQWVAFDSIALAGIAADFPVLTILNGYAVSAGHRAVPIHRIVTEAKRGVPVDHKDRNRLNNLSSNLRLCINGRNEWNTGLRKDNKTGFKGIFHDNGCCWAYDVLVNRKRIRKSGFKTAKDAALARDEVVRKQHGEFASLNFPKSGERGVHALAA